MGVNGNINVEPCQIHEEMYEEDCEICVSEEHALNAKFQAIMEATNVDHEVLMQKYRTKIDEASLLDLRLNMLLDVVFAGRAWKNRVRFEIAFAERFANIVNEATVAAKRRNLTEGVGNGQAPKLHIPRN